MKQFQRVFKSLYLFCKKNYFQINLEWKVNLYDDVIEHSHTNCINIYTVDLELAIYWTRVHMHKDFHPPTHQPAYSQLSTVLAVHTSLDGSSPPFSAFYSLSYTPCHTASPPTLSYQPAVLSILTLQPIHPPILPTYSPELSAYLPELMHRTVRAVSQLFIGVELYGFIQIYNFRLIQFLWILIYFVETHQNCS